MELDCIALDLDRTTLDKDGHLSPGNRAALRSAIERGIEVVIASGRSFASLPEDVVNLPGIRYAITSNGAAVCSVPDGAPLHRWLLPSENVARIRDAIRNQNAAPAVFMDGVAYGPVWYLDNLSAYGVTGYGIEYVKSVCRPVEDWEAFLDANAHRLDAFDVTSGDPDLRRTLFARLKAENPEVYFTSSGPSILEISHGDTGKGQGLRWLLNHLGLDPARCAAFGDGENDVDMLSFVGHGVAMENAAEVCKQAAEFVTLHHTEDGVAYAFRHFLCI